MTRKPAPNTQHCDHFHIDIRQLLAMLDRSELHEAARRANEFASDGYPRTGTDGPSGSGISRPTEAAALANNTADGSEHSKDPDRWTYDPTDHYAHGLRLRLTNAQTAITDLIRQINLINSRAEDPDQVAKGKKRRPMLGAGNCRACDIWCTGEGNDRLRGGLCDADRQRYRRTPEAWGHDINTYILHQKRLNKTAEPR